MQDVDNGHHSDARAIVPARPTDGAIVLAPGVLRRLLRLHARREGAELVAQAAITAAQQAQAALQQALNEVCEEEGLLVPEGVTAPIDIDWRSGQLRLRTGAA
jgi:hypothetical protein